MIRQHGVPRPLPEVGVSVPRSGGALPPTVPNPLTPGGAIAPYLPPDPPTVEVFPWWYQQWDSAPSWATSALNFVVAAGSVGPPAVPLVTVVPATFNFQCPAQNRAIVKSIRMTVQNPVATINLALTLFVNSAPVQGWTNIPFDPVSATAYILVFNDVNIRLDQNQILTAAFTEASNPASAWTCSLTASGWQVPYTQIDRIQQKFAY